MTDLKAALRQEIFARVRALSAAERLERSRQAVARLLASPEFAAARTVLAYDSGDTEVDTRELHTLCIAQGKTLCLPRMRKKERGLFIHAVANPQAELEPCRFGFREPRADLPLVPLNQLSLIIVPGVAFDEHGRRLGRGAGYYDRFLAQPGLHAVRCALAFERQLVPHVPALPHDLPVPLIFTESRVLRVTLPRV